MANPARLTFFKAVAGARVGAATAAFASIVGGRAGVDRIQADVEDVPARQPLRFSGEDVQVGEHALTIRQVQLEEFLGWVKHRFLT